MRQPRVAAIVLAAGSSSRMEGAHKLLEELDGRPLVRWSVAAAVEAECDPVVVVTGRCAPEVEAALPEGVVVEHNDRWEEGIAMSIRYGIVALPRSVDATFIALADMPLVRAGHYRTLVDRWRPGAIVVPTVQGRRGNPVLWAATYFIALARLRGDRGGRVLLERFPEAVVEVPVDGDGVLVDVDDRDDLSRARERR